MCSKSTAGPGAILRGSCRAGVLSMHPLSVSVQRAAWCMPSAGAGSPARLINHTLGGSFSLCLQVCLQSSRPWPATYTWCGAPAGMQYSGAPVHYMPQPPEGVGPPALLLRCPFFLGCADPFSASFDTCWPTCVPCAEGWVVVLHMGQTAVHVLRLVIRTPQHSSGPLSACEGLTTASGTAPHSMCCTGVTWGHSGRHSCCLLPQIQCAQN